VNPLLAANLGRWAEVYFSAPPEKRAQAVAELIEQLKVEAETKSDDASVQPQEKSTGAQSVPPEEELERSSPVRAMNESVTICPSCGHSNTKEERFCGMCGNPLPASQAERIVWGGAQRVFEPQPTASSPRPSSAIPGSTIPGYLNLTGDEPRNWSGDTELANSDLPSFAQAREPVPYRYRIYVGIVIAMVLGGLIYVAQRGDAFLGPRQSRAARSIPAAQTPATDAGAPSAEPPANEATQPVAKASAGNMAGTGKSAAAKQPADAASEATSQSGRPALQSGRANASSGPGNGDEELAAAQQYLKGNGAEAVPLLWKAVAKGNANATVTLADLYLHGDGVPKNCDQGRLLLDIAAKKGAKGATERLQNLPAFGCP
jgi:hypothetical protein